MKRYMIMLVASIMMATTIEVYFSPSGGARDAILVEVAKAESEIVVMAYGFTSDEIIDALADRNDSGVKLYLVLDKTNKNNPKLEKIRKWGAQIHIDTKHAIMHDKVIIIDGQSVITGSYNFSQNAERRNSENMLVIRSKELAEKYQAHFWERFKE